jgi:hypothetical protein
VPLSNGLDGSVIQPASQAVKELYVADRAVAAHDNLEDHVARDARATSFFCVLCLYLSQDPRRNDAGTRTKRSAASPATRTRTNARALALAEASAFSGSNTPTLAWPTALSFGSRLLQNANAIPVVCRGRDDRRDDDWQGFGGQGSRFGLGRVRDRLDWPWWFTLGHRATDLFLALSESFRWRRLLPQPAPPATTARSGRVQKHKAQRIGRLGIVLQRGRDRCWTEREDENRCGDETRVKRARDRQGDPRGSDRDRRLKHREQVAIARDKTTPEFHGFRVAQEARPAAKGGADTGLWHTRSPCDLAC